MENYTSDDYKKIANEKCKPYTNRLGVIFIIYYLIIGTIGFSFNVNFEEQFYVHFNFSLGNIISIVLTGPLSFGIACVLADVFNNKKPEYERLLDGFKKFKETFLTNLLINIYISLWSLLLIVPGIIKSLSYSMSYYILKDNDNISANEAITKSKELMNGHKLELFYLYLSYLGWMILCGLTFGILLFWVGPKIESAKYAFYLHITGKDKKDITDEEEDRYTVENYY